MKTSFFKLVKQWPSLSGFCLILLSRVLFRLIHSADNFVLFGDSYRYDILSDRILNGNLDLDFTAFIIAPGYPYLVALSKLIFDSNWMIAMTGFQFVLVAISGVYLFRIATLLFNNSVISWMSVILYSVYPFTLYYNFTFTQETCFQGFFIIFMYYFLRSIKKPSFKIISLSAVVFCICFLIKSHILLYSPFIALYYVINSKSLLKGIKTAIIFASICLISTIPNGLNNYKIHGVYTLSSYGTSVFFHNGNSKQYFDYLFVQNREESKGYLGFIFNKEYEYEQYGMVNKLNHRDKNNMHKAMALDWIKSNPMDALKLKTYSVWAFFRPGLSKKFFSFPMWFIGLIFSGPVFLFAYAGIYRNLKTGFKKHLWMLFLMFSVFLFYIIFMAQNRFRTITLDPLYLIYASESAFFLYSNYLKKKNTDL